MSQSSAGSDSSDDLFRWTDGRIVLLVERSATGWTVARGWLEGDALNDVRRWNFESPRRAIGQIRRLVREASSDVRIADAAANDVARWLGEPFPDQRAN